LKAIFSIQHTQQILSKVVIDLTTGAPLSVSGTIVIAAKIQRLLSDSIACDFQRAMQEYATVAHVCMGEEIEPSVRL
jgi:hypothetical protein